MVPEDYPDLPRFTYISEALWKTADVSGRSLVFSRPRKEAYSDTTICVAYIRLEQVETQETWPGETKRLMVYMDSNFCGHYVDSVADVKSRLCPLRDGDYQTVFWTTCREDTCYYPTKVGNPMPADTMVGVYPYWAGRDMQRMLDRGEDPLAVACDVAHDCGLKLFASYRRMTVRMPPFVFPLHPDALFMMRPDLRCADEQGRLLPHLSLAFPEVRERMAALFAEQAESYDIDGVHMFFCRGVPFVYFERPFLEAFQEEHGLDPRGLAVDDERVWRARARFFLQYLREVRAALDRAGDRRGRRLPIAMHVMNSLRTCLYYGMDIEAMVREGLVDVLIPARGHYYPEALGERHVTPEFLADFVAAAKPAGVRVVPGLEERYWSDGKSVAERAAAYYRAGADGLIAGGTGGARSHFEVMRRLGHADELDRIEECRRRAARCVRVHRVAGMPVDMQNGLPTCG